MSKVYPLNKRLMIKPNALETTTSSGIVVSSGTGEESRSALVVEVGPDVKNVKVGYNILLMWTKALPVRIAGEDFNFIDEDDVVAILDKV